MGQKGDYGAYRNARKVHQTDIADSAVGTSQLEALGVTTVKLANSAVTIPKLDEDVRRGRRNYLLNGDALIWQRGTTFTAASTPANDDDTILADRWRLLAEANDVVDVSQETSTSVLDDGMRAAFKLEVETANNQLGWLQILDHESSRELIGKTVSISFKAKVTSTNITNLRATILSWDGTADSVTTDVVTTWNGEGSDPTFVTGASSWTKEVAGADLEVDASWDTLIVSNVDIDTAGTNNVAVFIWVDNDDAEVDDVIYLSEIMLNIGSSSVTFEGRDRDHELLECQRFYERMDYVTDEVIMSGLRASNIGRYTIPFRTEKRAVPTITLAADGEFSLDSQAIGSKSAEDITTTKFTFEVVTTGSALSCLSAASDDASIEVDAEL